MTVEERILADMKEAMKEKQELRLRTLRSLRAALKNESIAKGEERGALSDQMALSVLTREAKKRRESIEQFKLGNRKDLADQEAEELEIIQAYLPEQLSEEKIHAIVEEVVKNISELEFGAVMRQAMEKLRGQADGALVSKIVKELLSK